MTHSSMDLSLSGWTLPVQFSFEETSDKELETLKAASSSLQASKTALEAEHKEQKDLVASLEEQLHKQKQLTDAEAESKADVERKLQEAQASELALRNNLEAKMAIEPESKADVSTDVAERKSDPEKNQEKDRCGIANATCPPLVSHLSPTCFPPVFYLSPVCFPCYCLLCPTCLPLFSACLPLIPHFASTPTFLPLPLLSHLSPLVPLVSRLSPTCLRFVSQLLSPTCLPTWKIVSTCLPLVSHTCFIDGSCSWMQTTHKGI